MRLHILAFFTIALLSQGAVAQDQTTLPHPGSLAVTFSSADMQDGVPVALTGWWFKSSQPGKRPTVIALHGCGGLYSARKFHGDELALRHAAMADVLLDAGYHVLFPDSFTARGKQSICAEKIGTRDITSANRRGDVQGALAWLATQADVDPSRIALLGWSHGGSTVLSSINASRPDVAAGMVQPVAAVAFYPGCQAYATARTPYHHTVPLLVLMGANDDWTPPAPCIALEKQQAARNEPMTLRLYADSYHDFDTPGLALRVRRDVPNGINPGEGVTTGGNALARAAAYKEMTTFLATFLTVQAP
jgi:dienelactone hydrolase